MPAPSSRPCPCGTGEPYARCCQPLHVGAAHAVTAEELMRSRYSAYVEGEAAHLLRTWHPRTRPADVDPVEELEWTGLEITEVLGGTADDEAGVVAFRAGWSSGGVRGQQVERSRFLRRGGRWTYLDGEVG